MDSPLSKQQPSPFPELEKIKLAAQRTTDRVEKLRLMKDWMDKAMVLHAEGQGRIKQMEEQRTREYGAPDDQQAQEMIRELEGDVAGLEQELESGVSVLMEEMGWLPQ
jgi:hypothetical protein